MSPTDDEESLMAAGLLAPSPGGSSGVPRSTVASPVPVSWWSRRRVVLAVCLLCVCVLAAVSVLRSIDAAAATGDTRTGSHVETQLSWGTKQSATQAVRHRALQTRERASEANRTTATAAVTSVLRPSSSHRAGGSGGGSAAAVSSSGSSGARAPSVPSRPVPLPVSFPPLAQCVSVPSVHCVFAPLVGNISAGDSLLAGPQHAYTWTAELHRTEQGPGAFVRIQMRDSCCTHVPLSYFRVTAHGAAQAAVPPPLALGPQPNDTIGSGHQTHIGARPGSGSKVITLGADEARHRRVLHTFLLLPDAGVYWLEVRLTHFNVSLRMTSESFPNASWKKRSGQWINRRILDTAGNPQRKIEVPQREGQTQKQREAMPLCGMERQPKRSGAWDPSVSVGFPLAGRWRLLPSAANATSSPRLAQSRRWLVEHSVWEPYRCRLDVSPGLLSRALDRVQWLHIVGDSNPRRMWFYQICRLAGGSVQAPDYARVSIRLNPPMMCLGPSSASGKDPTGASARWVVTYTSWFWPSSHPVLQSSRPSAGGDVGSPSFRFRDECARYVELQNTTRPLWIGWHNCHLAPPWIQRMRGPGATTFAWGSHAPELSVEPPTAEYMRSEAVYGLPYFKHHPTLFPLVSAVAPALIPLKFGTQQTIFNNERIAATNQLITAIITERLEDGGLDARPTTRAAMREARKQEDRQPRTDRHTGAGSAGTSTHAAASTPASSLPRLWLPVLDWFSPTHAASDALASDAAHFIPFLEEAATGWLAHYLVHAPNFQDTH